MKSCPFCLSLDKATLLYGETNASKFLDEVRSQGTEEFRLPVQVMKGHCDSCAESNQEMETGKGHEGIYPIFRPLHMHRGIRCRNNRLSQRDVNTAE